MIQTVKNFVFAQRTLTTNTIIGGIGAYINTVADLAAKLQVSVSFIRLFEKRGNDIFFKPLGGYLLKQDTFKNDSYITSYIDSEGFVYSIGSACFSGSTIKEAVFNRIESVGFSVFANTPLEILSCDNLIQFASNAIDGCDKLKTINAEKLIYILTYGARGTTSLINTNFKIEQIGLYAFANSSAILDLSKLTVVHNNCLQGGKYINASFDSLVTTGLRTSPFLNFTLCKNAYFPVLETIGYTNSFWVGWTSVELIDMKKLKTYGSTAGTQTPQVTGFINIKTGCIINVNIAMKTANDGLPHEAFKFAKNSRGATVNFYDDAGNYVSTL